MTPLVDAPFSTRWERVRGWLVPTVIIAVLAVVVAVLVALVVFDVEQLPDDANPDVGSRGDRILVNTRAGDPGHGDVVAFTRPNVVGLHVGRVVAVAGDTVAFTEAGLVLNGVPLIETYVLDSDHGPLRDAFVVPDATMYVLADDRSHAAARYMGTVPNQLVIGTVSAVIWPLW